MVGSQYRARYRRWRSGSLSAPPGNPISFKQHCSTPHSRRAVVVHNPGNAQLRAGARGRPAHRPVRPSGAPKLRRRVNFPPIVHADSNCSAAAPRNGLPLAGRYHDRRHRRCRIGGRRLPPKFRTWRSPANSRRMRSFLILGNHQPDRGAMAGPRSDDHGAHADRSTRPQRPRRPAACR
jgi:hypothetical protein